MSLTDLQPGEYVVLLVSDIDVATFQARRGGLEVRDCFSIQAPNGPLVGVLLRAPLEGTVVDQVVRRGTGTMDVDSGRIATSKADAEAMERCNTPGSGRMYASKGQLGTFERSSSSGALDTTQGRFPSNFLLIHGPECEYAGVRDMPVKGGGPVKGGSGYRRGGYEHGQKDVRPSFAGYTTEDGTEEVANWNCQPNCPVRLLDLQSGRLQSGMMEPGQKRKKSKGLGGYQEGFPDEATSTGTYGDSGGASRFYYQVTALDGIKAYLQTLTGTDVAD